ncbi:reverse transcriptase N-terminal domain-containing protein [Streptomyces sviceus]|uniref:reverse transcriptase N-terminal domain-containing protein n=1 Tax=Streptomyces sviceus TaxID=285530 RepID=UPI0036CCE7A0
MSTVCCGCRARLRAEQGRDRHDQHLGPDPVRGLCHCRGARHVRRDRREPPPTEGQVGRHGCGRGERTGGRLLRRLDSIDWNQAEENVRRLRQHIFTASRDGDLANVKDLQKLMLRSLSNTLVSVRRVTEVNAGRKAAGTDGQVVLTAPGKPELARFIQQHGSIWQARSVRRVFIPKAGGNGDRSAFP